MPDFRKLEREEVQDLTRSRKAGGERARIREQYQNFLVDLAEGEGGEVKLTNGDNRATIKNRLKAAAEALEKDITFIRSGKDVVLFRIGSGQDE
jgi:predicted DNA-binding antitoxin AbrB/MazE fold protein